MFRTLLFAALGSACGRTALLDEPPSAPERQAPAPRAQLSGNNEHFCRLSGDGVLSCWGDNHDGALGDGTTSARATPFVHPGRWREVTASLRSTCAIDSGGSLWCWGSHVGAAPRRVGLEGGWRHVVMGMSLVVAEREDGTLWTWPGTLVRPDLMRQLGGRWGALAMGLWERVCGRREDDALVCGDEQPERVVVAGDVRAFDVAGEQLVVAQADGSLRKTQPLRDGPVVWSTIEGPLSDARDVRLSTDAVCALGDDARLACARLDGGDAWPALVSVAGRWSTVAVGRYRTCGIREDDSTWCWVDASEPARVDVP